MHFRYILGAHGALPWRLKLLEEVAQSIMLQIQSGKQIFVVCSSPCSASFVTTT